MEELKPHISVSQMNMIKRCPRQYYYRYILGQKTAPGIALVTGSSFDEAYNINYKQKIESKADLPVTDVQDAFSTEFDKRMQEVEDKDEQKTKGKVKDIITRGIVEFHKVIAPQVIPVEVQKELRVPLDEEYDLLGFIDVVTETHIRDTKTAGRMPTMGGGHYNLQLQAYVWAYNKLYGKHLDAALDYLVKTKEPSAVTDTLSNIDIEGFLRHEQGTIDFIKALYKNPDLAFENRDGWHCSEKFCGFYKECQGG